MASEERPNPLVSLRERIGKIQDTPEILVYKAFQKDSINAIFDSDLANTKALRLALWKQREMLKHFGFVPTAATICVTEFMFGPLKFMREQTMSMYEQGSDLKRKHAGLLLDFEKGFFGTVGGILVEAYGKEGEVHIGSVGDEGIYYQASLETGDNMERLKLLMEEDPSGLNLIRSKTRRFEHGFPGNGTIESYEDQDTIIEGSKCAANAFSKLYPLAEEVMLQP